MYAFFEYLCQQNKEFITQMKKKESDPILLLRFIAFIEKCSKYELHSFMRMFSIPSTELARSSKRFIDNGLAYQVNDNRDVVLKIAPTARLSVIVSTPVEIAKKIHEYDNDNSFYSNSLCSYYTYAINTYCRFHPEIIRKYAYNSKLGYEIEMPTDREAMTARKEWESISEEIRNEHPSDDYKILPEIVCDPLFRDFCKAMPQGEITNAMSLYLERHTSFECLPEGDKEYMLDYIDKVGVPNSTSSTCLHDKIIFTEDFLHNGDIDRCLAAMHDGTLYQIILLAIRQLQQDSPDMAFAMMNKVLKDGNCLFFLSPYLNYIYGLSMFLSKTTSTKKKIATLTNKKIFKEHCYSAILNLFIQLTLHPEADLNKWVKDNIKGASILEQALITAVCHDFGIDSENKDIIKKMELAGKNGFMVFLLSFAPLLKDRKDKVQDIEESTKMHNFILKVKQTAEWEKVLDALMIKCDIATSPTKTTNDERNRISYYLNTKNFNVTPRLQKSKDGGKTWTKGRNIALASFKKGMPEMTLQDSKVAAFVEMDSGWYYGKTYYLEGKKVVEALAGHPFVYNEKNPSLRIDIQAEQLQVEVNETASGYKIKHNAIIHKGDLNELTVRVVSEQLIKVMRLTSKQIELINIFERSKTFPKEAKAKLTQVLEPLGKMITIVSPLLKNVNSVISKKGDTTLTMQLIPMGEEIIAKCFVKPVQGSAPYCTPGKGIEYIATTINGKAVQVERNLKAETKNYKQLTEWMTPFEEYADEDRWRLPAAKCLELLDMLREHQEECRIEWPEGVMFKVNRPMLNASDISLSVKGVNHWFEIDGDVKVDDKISIKVADLLRKIREAKGNFIEIGDKEYIAISQQLRKQLAALDRVVQTEHKQLRVAQFNTSFLQDLEMSGINFNADKKYSSLMKNLEEADTMKISVPKALQADLRDYQKDGFRWLSKLAHWGAGACLADDMGLGKTVQTIALLLSHAADGASLVIMPTSVLLNWRDEVSRFAPSLNVHILRNAADRKETVDKAGAYDIVLATYGLLPTEEDILTGKRWNIIVLDEAHNIKNKETKTSKVMMMLEAKFRLLLTGTPLQNHLSEIWNLFQFATPGLLPGYTQFTQQFINPIEHEQDKERQRLLKRILMPFILRRTKTEVLSELPQKTEITLKVELSPAERALYEQFRQEAVANLEDGSTSPIQALAELTKLRQTACNAALVMPKKEAKSIPSSKMESFLKLVEELRLNHHRALVFSQFTSHLALVREQLDAIGIKYNYLDGSTSPSERISLVKSFQEGDMPLFLISLKAGGTGLNLTAADYVIHLDPWWNPAIEDQASDRTYRIGQKKPVTVYRLIATDTIEEKIIELHKTKKSLADALLEGSDISHTLGKDEILALLQEGINQK